MSNTLTLTSLLENIFRAKDRVCREPTGFAQSVMVNSGSEGISINGTVLSHRTAQPTLNSSYTPAMTIPAGDDQTVTAESMTIGQVANVRIPLRGEDIRQLDNTAGQKVIDDMFSQAIRKIVNTIETHLGTIIYKGAARATGTAGTTPFASNMNILADVRQILVDNGCPLDGDISTVLNTTAGTKLRQLSNLYKANEAGDTSLLRRGELLNLMGMSIKESAGIASHTAGTGASATTDNTGYAVGARTLTLASAGTGTLLAGDVVTFAGDSNKYVLNAGDADVSGGGTLVLNHPGLLVAMSAATKAITVGAAYTANLSFHRTAVELVMRPPAQPLGGDAAVDRQIIVDDVTGLVFDVALYKGYGMNMVDFTVFYQGKVWKPEFVATLLG